MKVDSSRCDCCPDVYKDLLLIETRFVDRRCFAELQCRVCGTLWTAEIGPAPDAVDLGAAELAGADLEDEARWRVLDIQRRTVN